MDNIEVIGDKIWLGGYVVAEISTDAPSSVSGEFRDWLETMSGDIGPKEIEDFREFMRPF